jgi:hypothetical protein
LRREEVKIPVSRPQITACGVFVEKPVWCGLREKIR